MIYQVRVRGLLGEQWADRFEGLTLTQADGDTLLTGVVDQAALHGLLKKVRDLGMQLVSVIPMERETVMDVNTSRRTARIVGALFILATAASLLGTGLTGSIVGAPDYLVQIAANHSLIVLGALVKFVGAAASAGIAIALYPVLRRHNEGLALGSVGFRIIEGVFYIVGILCLLSLLSLGQQYVGAEPQAAPALQSLGDLIHSVDVWAGFVLGVIAFCLGAAMYNYVLYRSRLVPRWLSAWGLAALALLFSMVLSIAFGEGPSAPSGTLVLLAIPLAVQEMVMAVWLIVKGFSPSAIDAGKGS